MLLSIGLGGCKDWIDLKPENSLVFKNAFESERDVEAALLGVEQSVRLLGLLKLMENIQIITIINPLRC